MVIVIKATYITLEDYMLTDEECAAMDEWHKIMDQAAEGRVPDNDTLVRQLSGEQIRKAHEINKRLTAAMHRRSETADKLIKK